MSNRHEELKERLSDFVAHVMARTGVPGVVIGLLHEGQASVLAFGVTNVDHPLPVTSETLFQVGSITKTFVATAAMRLVERGELDLDVPLRTYVPGFRVADEEASARATMRHLLTHMGGWAGDFFHDTGAGNDALARYVADMAELPQLAPIDSHWSYNNAGFSLAGHVIEVVTGRRFEAALKELVLEPLGLHRTYLDPGEVMTHRFVVGHDVDEGTAHVARPWPLTRSAYPAGGLVTDVGDLLCYARFHLSDGHTKDGTQVLTSESLVQMQTPLVTIWGKEARGLAWLLEDVGGARLVSHGGGTKGQISLLCLVPERGFALAVLTNANQGGSVTEDVRRWALGEYLDLDVPKPEPIESSLQDLCQYVGFYRGYYSDLELGLLAGRLVGQEVYKRSFPSEDVPPDPPPPPMSLALCEEDRLLVLDGPDKGARADAIRNPDGSIGWLRVSGRLHVREGK